MDTNPIDSLDPRELGLELARARKSASLTQEEAAKLIEVARTTITAIEKGERKIRAGELIKLARAYGRQVSDFVRPRPSIEPFHKRVHFRGPFSRTEQDDEVVAPYITRFEELCRDYLELEQITGSTLKRRYPAETPVPSSHLASHAEALAQEERNRLGLGDGPLASLRDVLEQEVGLRVFFIKMPAAFSAMYVYSEPLGGCVAINSDHPEERRRWSMAHEHAHFLTNRYKTVVSIERPSRFRREPDSEKFADLFPLYFLMPTAGLLRRVAEMRQGAKDNSKESLRISDLFRLAHRYGVSPQALVRHLEDLRELPAGTWDQLRNRVAIREAQERLGLGEIPGRADVLPVRYRQLAFHAYDEGLISEAQLAQFLRVEGRLEARALWMGDASHLSAGEEQEHHLQARASG